MQGFHQNINEGMKVYSRDGESLGKVTRCLETGFEIEKGFFFPKEYWAQYNDISTITDDGVYLNATKDDLSRWQSTGENVVEESAASRPYTSNLESGREASDIGITGGGVRSSEAGIMGGDIRSADTGTAYTGTERAASEENLAGRATGTEEGRLELKEEQVRAEKTMRDETFQVGKHVETETKEFSVPVMREEAHVERVPVDKPLEPGQAQFKDETVSVPLREEEVHVEVRPVVKEELRVTKDQVEEEKRVKVDLKKERPDIASREVQRKKDTDLGDKGRHH